MKRAFAWGTGVVFTIESLLNPVDFAVAWDLQRNTSLACQEIPMTKDWMGFYQKTVL
jgi:hypothetical protein